MYRVQPEDVLQYSMCGRCTLSDTDCTMTTVLLVCRCHAWSWVICAGVQGQVSCGFAVNAYGKLNTLVLPNLALCLASSATSTCCACHAVSWLQRSNYKTMGLQPALIRLWACNLRACWTAYESHVFWHRALTAAPAGVIYSSSCAIS